MERLSKRVELEEAVLHNLNIRSCCLALCSTSYESPRLALLDADRQAGCGTGERQDFVSLSPLSNSLSHYARSCQRLAVMKGFEPRPPANASISVKIAV